MDWIKKFYDQFALAILALALLASAVVAILSAQDFPGTFANLDSGIGKPKEVVPMDKGPLETASAKLQTQINWTTPASGSSLFVAHLHLIDPQSKMPRRIGGPGDPSVTHPPVRDSWILKYNLNLLSPKVLTEDADGDGFTNLDEYLNLHRTADGVDGSDSTNPTNPASHPPYYTKLFLKKYQKVPFRIRFDAYDGDAKTTKPEEMSFQINALDLHQPTEFLKIGEMVRNTRYKLSKFEYKTKMNESTQIEEDVSELILVNTETNENITLVLRKVTDSPDSYAIFTYKWPEKEQEIRVKKLQEFVLRPEVQQKYKLIDIKETEAVIALPSGDKYTVYPPSK